MYYDYQKIRTASLFVLSFLADDGGTDSVFRLWLYLDKNQVK